MGSGKGAPEYWVAVVKNQKVMFEIGGVSEEEAREALRLAQHKLPIKTKIIAREEMCIRDRDDVCPICGKPAKKMIYWGVAY